MKLGDYYEGYYKGYMRYLAPGTAQGYDGDWRNHIAGEFGGWEMEDIRVRHINAWLASDHFAGVPGAARSAYKTLRQILRSAMGDELYSDEVVDSTTRVYVCSPTKQTASLAARLHVDAWGTYSVTGGRPIG